MARHRSRSWWWPGRCRARNEGETDMLDRHVRYKVDQAVGWVTLDRPEAMNALSEEVFADLFDVLRSANDDPGVRVLVITGAGPHFCAGGDLAWEQQLD